MNNLQKTSRNNLHLLLLSAALIATSGLLAACGGGGGGGGGAATATQSFGEITKKGSVTVNGVKFETTGATVVMDGGVVPAPGDDSKLREGMVVAVEGDINDDGVTGTATKVTFDDTLQGPVINNNAAGAVTGTITVLGKTVAVTPDTKIDDSVGGVKTLDDVDTAGMVEVSGGVDDQGRIVATHIELKGVNEISEVTGKVDQISPLVVSGIIVNGTLPAGIVVGNLVEVKGSFDGTSLTAATIELKNGIQNDDNLHFEGFVMPGGNSGSFVLQGHHLNQTLTVTTSATTIFMGGVKDDLVVGTKVEVQGVLTGTTIVATKVKFKENVRIEIAAGAQLSTREGIELHFLPGVTVVEDTTIRKTGEPNILDTSDLRIRGRLSRDGSKVIATRLEIRPPSSNPERVKLRGPVTVINGTSSIVILGVTIPAGTVFRPNDDNSNDDNAGTMSAADFFAKVKVGTVVKADGTLSADNTFVTRELELED